MDIDMPFVLTWAVLICGAIWLFDSMVLKPRRIAAAGANNNEQENNHAEHRPVPSRITHSR